MTERGVADVADALGLTVIERPPPGSISPCPACGLMERGDGERRGPVGVTRDGGGWRCHRCDNRGDALDLAAWKVLGRVPPKGDPAWREVRAACANAGLCTPGAGPPPVPWRPPPPPRPPAPPPPARPPEKEVRALWDGALPVNGDDLEVRRWLKERGLDAKKIADAGLARALDRNKLVPAWARSYSHQWSDAHRLLVQMFDAKGSFASLHARRLGPAPPKSLSPKGYEVAGLVMANGLGRKMLQGKVEDVTLWIVEGVPDFLKDASNKSDAVLGIISGSWSQELANRIPKGATIIIATHDDEAGEKYFEKIYETLKEHPHGRSFRIEQEPRKNK